MHFLWNLDHDCTATLVKMSQHRLVSHRKNRILTSLICVSIVLTQWPMQKLHQHQWQRPVTTLNLNIQFRIFSGRKSNKNKLKIEKTLQTTSGSGGHFLLLVFVECEAWNHINNRPNRTFMFSFFQHRVWHSIVRSLTAHTGNAFLSHDCNKY